MGLLDNIGKDALRTVPTIDIGFAVSVLGDVFGFNSPVYIPYSLKDKYALSDARYNLSFVADDEADRLSQFGTPVLGTFKAVAGDLPYQVYSASGRLIERDWTQDFEFPAATIVDFSRAKSIIKTPTIGSAGTVKEIFGFEDWKINIRGVCLDDGSRSDQKTAKQQCYAMSRMNEIAGSIKVEGRIFQEKYIDRITIENLIFTAVQGKPGVIQYEMECVSDEPFLLLGI